MTGAAIGGIAGGPRGAAIGALAGAALIDAPAIAARNKGNYYAYQNQTCWQDPWGRIVCQQVIPQQQIFYANPPLYPAYPWQYYYYQTNQPGFVFFFGQDGRHRRHRLPRH